MGGGWTMGAPRVRLDSGEVVEVTDGNKYARARCCFPLDDFDMAPAAPAWLDESGAPLGWQPTHWRPTLSPDVVYEVE